MASNVTRNPSYLTRPLEVKNTSSQLKLSYDTDSYGTITVADDSHATIATAESGKITLDAAGDIELEAAGADIILRGTDSSGLVFSEGSDDWSIVNGNDNQDIIFKVVDNASVNEIMRLNGDISSLDIYSGRALTFGAVGQFIRGDGTDLDITSGNDLAFKIARDFKVDAEGDIVLNANGGDITLKDDTATFVPTEVYHATTKEYVDLVVNAPCIPVFFNERTASRTYFRNADDAYNAWEWDGYDSEDATTVNNTITITTGNLYSGYLVPVDCTLIGARWNLYQSYNVSGNIHAQIWTADPEAGATATLRITNSYTANRAFAGGDTVSVAVDLDAGDMIIPAFQWVDGANSTWYGAVTLKLKRR